MSEDSDAVAKLVELTEDIRIAMLTTVDEQGRFIARPMAQQVVEPDGVLWFFAEADSSLVGHIAANPQVGITSSSSDVWVSINGTAAIEDDPEHKKALWNPFVEAWIPQGPDDPSVLLIKVEGESAEYWDTPGGRVASAFSFVKAKVTGEPYDGGDSAKVDL